MTMPGRDRRDIVVDVTIKSDTRGANEAAAGLEKVDKSADKAGESMRGMGDDARALNLEIERTTQRIAELDRQLIAVGNDKGLRKQLRGEEAWLRDLNRVSSRVAPNVPDVRPGFGNPNIIEAPNFPTPHGGHGALIAILVGAAVAAAPTMGAIISGALAGAIGTVGVAGGLAMASKDPRVRTAAEEFAKSISAEFFRGGEAFVGPAIRSLDILEDAFKDMKVPESFAKMAPWVETIAEGFGDLGRNVMPGLNKAFDRMGPFAHAAERGISDLGGSLGYFMDKVTESEGAVMGLQSFFDLIDGLIRTTGFGLGQLSKMYADWMAIQRDAAAGLEGFALGMGNEDWAQVMGMLAGHFNDLMNVAPTVGESIADVARMLSDYETKATLASDATKSLTTAISDAHHQFLDWKGAQIAVEEALDRVAEGLKKNGTTLDVNTEKGRDNLTNLKRMAEAAEDAALKRFTETQSVEQATSVYESYKRRLMETLDRMGFTRAEAKRLADEWLGIGKLPPQILEVAIKYTEINQPPRFLASGDVQVYGGRHLAGSEPGFASGGTTPAFAPFRVHRDESVWSDRQHYVATAAQTRAMATGGSAARVVIDIRGGSDDLQRVVAGWVRVEGPEAIGLPASVGASA